jgi:hypothetical protein
MRFVDFISASSLKQQSVGRHVAPIGHIILISCLPIFFLVFHGACLAEMKAAETYHTRGEHTLTIKPQTRLCYNMQYVNVVEKIHYTKEKEEMFH